MPRGGTIDRPASADPFVGRRRELEELQDLLERERFVALVGAVGEGKSTLARMLCETVPGRRRILHLDCEAEADPLAALAGALGKRSAAEAGPWIRSALASRKTAILIFFDGLEDPPEALVDELPRWLRRSHNVKIVTTSTRLHRLGGHQWEVPPLELEEGIELLIQRAGRQGAEGWTGADRKALQAVVERLDGSPLALILAASRARTLRPRQLLSLLDQGLEPLRTQGRGRHASAEAAAAWQWGGLAEKEARLLEVASVFEGGIPLEALPSLGFPRDAALDLLSSLRDASAIRRDGERFRIPALLRWYARRRLEARGAAAVEEARRAQARFCASLFSDHPGGDEALPVLSRERANLLAAHRFGLAHEPTTAARMALGLGRVYAVHGPADAEEAIKNAGVEAARAAGDEVLLARLLRDRAILAIRLGKLVEARLDLEEFETLARASGDRSLEAQASLEQGRLRFAQGDFETAQILFTRAAEGLSQLRAGSDAPTQALTFLLGYARNFLGMVREAQGHLSESADHFEAALDLFRRAGNRRYRSIALMNLGVARYLGGELDEAISLFDQTIASTRALGDRAGEGDALVNLGSVLLLKGNLGEAERYLRLGLERERELGNRRAESMALGNLGIVAHERGELRTAEELLRAAVDTARLSGERNFWAHYLGFHGAVSAALGDRAGARSDLAAARSWFESLGDPGHLATVGVLEAFLDLDDPAARGERLAAALSLVEGGGPGSRSAGTRLACRLLDRAIELRSGGAVGGRREAPRLEIGPETGWFRFRGDRIDLGRRPIARRLLRALVERRLAAPGVGLCAERLAAEGWPDENAPATTLSNRLYVAINTLRRLGLDDAILRRDDGYLLDPTLPLRRRS